MKRILIMNDIVYGGGVEKVMLHLIEELLLQGYNITVLTNVKDNSFYKYYNKKVEYLYINKVIFKNKNIIFKILNKMFNTCNTYIKKKIIKQANFDIAIAMKEGRCMKFISNIDVDRKFAWVHTDFNTFHWTKGVFKSNNEFECMKKFEKIICVSYAVKDGVNKQVGELENLVVRYNPIDFKNIIKFSKEKVDESELYKPNSLLFITVGRLDKQKGYDRLLETCSKLNNEGLKYELWIIGEGEERINLENYIEENKLINVKLLGPKQNPYKYMKLADWYICASRSESFCIAMYEAIILDLPVITTECPGAIELFEQNVNGLVTKNSQEGLYEVMKQVIDNIYIKDKFKNKTNSKYNEVIQFSERIKDITNLLK